MEEIHDGEPRREFEDIYARVRVLDGQAVTMEICSSTPHWDVGASLVVEGGVDDEAVMAWVYGQFDQVLADLRRLVRRGQFARGGGER